jgi:hypothetical protein
MATRLVTRAREVVRVLDGSAVTFRREEALGTSLKAITCLRVDQLVVSFSVDMFGRDEISDPEVVDALYDPKERVLYWRGVVGQERWAAIARELAQALGVDGEGLGTVASGLREVIAAASASDAALVLDELGFPHSIEHSMVERTENMFEALGGLDSPIVADEESVESDGRWAPEYADSVDAWGSSASSGTGTRRFSGDRAEEIAGGTAASADDGSIKRPSNADHTTGAATRGEQSKLRSYVRHKRGETGDGQDEGRESERRNAIDAAGVRRAIDSELECGRFPTEMPHAHPGYDIESKDKAGHIVRYIEVKSTGVAWDAQGVALSDVQFDRARSLGDAYWLYVVDRALDGAAVIHRIQNPAQRVGQYFFDGGWRGVAE